MNLSPFVVDLNAFEFRAEIGSGTFGTVVVGITKETGEEVAIKRLKKPILPRLSDQRTFLRELEILAVNDHPCCLRLVGFHFNHRGDVGPTLVTPLMRHGTLDDILKRERAEQREILTPTQRSIVIFGVVAGMAGCHARGIIHRDLKPANIFLNDAFEPVIADFGISRYCDAGIDKTMELGSPLFMAPELSLNETGNYDFSVDVYAFAMTLYACFATPAQLDDRTGKIQGGRQLIRRVSRGARFVRPRKIPDHIWEMITACWRGGAQTRPTFWALLQSLHNDHGYMLRGADWEAVVSYEERVYREFGGPQVCREREEEEERANGEAKSELSPEQSARFGAMIDALLDTDPPESCRALPSSLMLAKSIRMCLG